MKILALEFSTELRSVALVETGGTTIQQIATASASDRAVGGLRLVEQVLKETGLKPADVNALAIGLGPGSYTGIRVALAMAQGWQLANGVEVRGVSSALCVAHQAAEQGITGRVAVAMDAQRGEFYLGTWEISGSNVSEVEPLWIVAREVVQQQLQQGVSVVGPGLAEVFPGARDLTPEAVMLAKLSAGVSPQPAESWEPIYLRATSFVKAPPPRIIA